MLSPEITRTADHHYWYQGNVYPGVTSVLKVIDKSDALMNWAARNTAEAAVALAMDWEREPKHVPEEVRVTSALHKLLDTVGQEGAIKALTSRSSWKRDEAAQLGIEVHSLGDDIANGRPLPSTVTPIARERAASYADWWKNSGWTLRTSEAMVLEPSAGYGGTLDLLARDRDDATVLADIKTGKGVYREALLQLTAYGMATILQTPDFRTYAMPEIDRYVILHVTADGVREVECSVGQLERMAWLACIELSRWAETTKGKRL